MFNLGPQELFWLFLILLLLIPLSKIVRKAGFSGWWTLLYLVPVVNVLAVWYLAFAKWPALRVSRTPGEQDVKVGR